MISLILIALLGVISGVRTFTGPAVFWIVRHGGPLAYVLSGAALFEYFYDVHPQSPPRTCTSNLVARLVSGAFVGWSSAAVVGVSTISGTIAGSAGALAGAYGSEALRKRCTAMMGNVMSGLLEDLVTIVAAFAIVVSLR